MSDGEEHEPKGPRPIKKLSKDVINQIAAAEIIHRPANAIKELLENSLDAGSTSIKITVKEGGLKLLQIADNGHGINKSDLPLLCTRYATSKLSKFSDLERLQTYGFRGEALASVSYCSHVEVVTKTRDDGCGWKAHYQDGVLVPSKPGLTPDPRPTAANDGTVISAEDLFYNNALRKRAFKSPSEEYNRILDVITKYAVHNPHCAWVCKKAGTALPDISTPAASTSRANISLLYGATLANELLELPKTTLDPIERLGARCEGLVSNANSNWARKGGWLLFINHRLVDSSRIKKAVDSLYTAFLPKGASPWVYLSLEIDPSKVDVNVSPTKSEVHFLNEDEMIEAIVAVVQTALAGANVSRSFTVQTLLPGAPEPPSRPRETEAGPSKARKPAPNYKVRVDSSHRTLDSMITISDPSQLGRYTEIVSLDTGERPHKRRVMEENGTGEHPLEVESDEEGQLGVGERESSWDAPREKGRGEVIPESGCELESVQELRRGIRKKGSAEVTEMLSKHAFVGIVDRQMCLSLFQHSTKLYLVNHVTLADEHFYQLSLRQFGAFNRLRLDPPPDLGDLLRLAVSDEPGILAAGLDSDVVVDKICRLLLERREMIDEYFSLRISEDGEVETLPMILKGYTPNLDRLPHFLLCLGTRVNWEIENECFHTFLQELSFFYSPRPFSNHYQSPSGSKEENGMINAEEITHQDWQLEHVLYPSFRRYTHWSRDILKDLKQVANLPDLFRVFERC
ncbi:hypothetical protein TREMEDRAFT_69817 [Tremella mesenterica DSM 1558]|nr:uncharacterized protein TREMEDRAFT_69817 [Tremella mesenterica DSM 1558]EIW67366.1 hypothetical protein TREMEDRAFT_69817 [Tremella mesenterica DSM 1558]